LGAVIDVAGLPDADTRHKPVVVPDADAKTMTSSCVKAIRRPSGDIECVRSNVVPGGGSIVNLLARAARFVDFP
jgi:hypothetical protein